MRRRPAPDPAPGCALRRAEDRGSPESLRRPADAAMYMVKKSGRNHYAFARDAADAFVTIGVILFIAVLTRNPDHLDDLFKKYINLSIAMPSQIIILDHLYQLFISYRIDLV